MDTAKNKFIKGINDLFSKSVKKCLKKGLLIFGMTKFQNNSSSGWKIIFDL